MHVCPLPHLTCRSTRISTGVFVGGLTSCLVVGIYLTGGGQISIVELLSIRCLGQVAGVRRLHTVYTNLGRTRSKVYERPCLHYTHIRDVQIITFTYATMCRRTQQCGSSFCRTILELESPTSPHESKKKDVRGARRSTHLQSWLCHGKHA